MAVTVAADNNRIAVGTIATDTGTWGNDGGGGGTADEPDIVYEGTTAQSRKVSTSRIGRSYDAASTVSASTADREHFIFKVNITNYAALLARAPGGGGPAAGLKIGSASTAYYEYYVLGNDNYPALGGWQIIAIDPKVTGYRDATQGSPSLTAIDYYSLLADFSATSKSENVVIDAIDQGAGLVMTGGTPDGVYQDFVNFDQGTSGNRFGYVTTKEGIIYVMGRLAIGENTSGTAVATQFTDSGKTIVFSNSWASTGFFTHRVNLGNASTTFDITNVSISSRGEKNNTLGLGYTTTEDTRLVLEFLGTAGTATLTGGVLQNLSALTLTSAVNIAGATLDAETITQAGASINNTTITTTSVVNVATLADPTFGTSSGLRNTDFIQGGAGHALEIDTATSYDLTNITFTGYAASDGSAGDEAIYVSASSGTVTLNILGGTSPSVRTAGATVVKVINPVTLTVTVRDAADNSLIEGARVYVRAANGTGDLPYQDSISITRSGSTATVTHTAHGMATNDWVRISGATQPEYNGLHQITVTGTNSYTYTVTGTPATPATGSPIATGVLINALTNASGVASFTRSYGVDQDFTGWARKGTSSPLYKQSPIVGTLDKDTGTPVTVPLVGDE